MEEVSISVRLKLQSDAPEYSYQHPLKHFFDLPEESKKALLVKDVVFVTSALTDEVFALSTSWERSIVNRGTSINKSKQL